MPPKADAEFVWRMEDVIQTYFLPYDPAYPVICFDEACKQLFGEVRPFQLPGPGMRARLDYEYERKGVCHQLMMCEPLRGWRHVQVTERRTRRDYAACVRELVDVHYPRAKQIRLIQGSGSEATTPPKSEKGEKPPVEKPAADKPAADKPAACRATGCRRC